jgi:threonylcarbamoyladenosine tRNA methylthiotransferase MtaB
MNTEISRDYRFFIKTLGCKVNQYESQAIRESMLSLGFKECLSKETADIYILNTCTVTHKADTESRHWAGVFHKTNPNAKIVITGCCAETDSGSFSFLPGVCNIIKNEDKGRIADVLTGNPGKASGALSITDFKDHSKAFVKIQDGCSNLCAYCKVPLVRGGNVSKPVKDVAKEVGLLVSKGFKEIVLTGICLGAWGQDTGEGSGIVAALKELERIEGSFRVRLSSIEPKYVTDELIGYMSSSGRVCRHLHIPIQSGDDAVLAAMNRPYTAGELNGIVAKARKSVEGIGITTDIMVGFPGESDANLRNTVKLVKDILPVRVHIFPFSAREGTAAFSMAGEVPQEVIKNRFQAVRASAIAASYLYRCDFRNRLVDVLVESKRERYSNRLTGYSDNYIRVSFDGPDSMMRKISPVKIEEPNLTCTLGSIVQPTRLK